MNRRLLLVFILLLSLLPALYLSYIHYVDSFLYTPLASTSEGIALGGLTDVSSDQPSYVVILYTISSICNIPPLQLGYLPIGALIYPFCIYALTRNLLESKWIPLLLLLYFSFDFSILIGQYSVFAYAWAHPLFFIFILLFIKYSVSETRNPQMVALLLIVFTSIVFLHPTYVFWAISFTIGLNVIIGISKATRLTNVHLTPTPFLTIALFVIYFGFNQLYFGFYLHRVILIEPETISEQFITTIRNFLGFQTPVSVPYQMSGSAATSIIGYASFGRSLIIVLSLLIGIFAWVRKNYHELSKKFDSSLVVITALLIAGMMHTIGYAFYGHISMRFMIMFFPIIAIFLIRKSDLKKSVNMIIALLLVLAFAGTISYAASNQKVNNIDIETVPYSDWLISHTEKRVVLLSDFTTSQLTKCHFSEAGRSITQRFYYSELYSMIVSGKEQITNTEFIAMNWETGSTTSVGWSAFEPVSKYYIEISENTHLNRIFDDGHISLLRSTYFH